jgi:riboflavin transporter FmnP
MVGVLVIGLCTGVSILGLVGFNAVVKAETREKDNETVGLTYAIVAVIFAVLVAVIVVDVWDTASRAREITTGEANQLSSLVMQSSGLQPAMAQTVRTDVNQYVDLVVKREWLSQQAGKVGDEVYAPGWAVVGDLAAKLSAYEPSSLGENATKAEMLGVVNALIKARHDRILAATEHTSDDVWLMLIIAGAVSVIYTYLFGAKSFRIHVAVTGLVAASIALVFVLIIELDYPFRGELHVSDEAFVSVRATSEAAAPGAPTGAEPAPSAAEPAPAASNAPSD